MCPTTGAPWAQPWVVLRYRLSVHSISEGTFSHLLIYHARSGLTSLVVCLAEVQELKMILEPEWTVPALLLCWISILYTPVVPSKICPRSLAQRGSMHRTRQPPCYLSHMCKRQRELYCHFTNKITWVSASKPALVQRHGRGEREQTRRTPQVSEPNRGTDVFCSHELAAGFVRFAFVKRSHVFTSEFDVKQLLCWLQIFHLGQNSLLIFRGQNAVQWWRWLATRNLVFCYQHILPPGRAELAKLHTAGHLYTLKGVEMLSLNAGDAALLGLVGQRFQV